MKRKLDADNVPMAQPDDSAKEDAPSFTEYGLDARLLQAIAKQRFSTPTPVQAKVLPLALEGKDILARSKTGSGKTAAYLLPILQSILKRKSGINDESYISALILVPTRELAEQVLKSVTSLTAFCARDIRAINLTHKVSDAVQRSLLADLPDIVIATPARASNNIKNGSLVTTHLTHLVIDEADLVMSYGYEEDLENTAQALPKGIQSLLMSATLNTEVDTVKSLFCKDPAVVTFNEKEDESGALSQFVVRCAEDEKFLLVYVIFKLKLIKGKCIIFVGDIDRCYRLKLYLEQFGIKSCVLNSELPVNSRIHVVEEFNKNIYDIIIATDEHEMSSGKGMNGEQSKNGPQNGNSNHTNGDAPRKRRKRDRRDTEYGVSRGIDFKNVACVLNFDLPTSSTSYTHRIGRTARAGNSGMALSFVIPRELYRKHKSTSIPSTKNDETVLEQIMADQREKGKEVTPYQFDMKQVIAFRYRMEDALRAVTGLAVREARAREIRQELLKSEKLKRHFEENPSDLHHLRHDTESRSARIQSHLKHIPDYLLPGLNLDGGGLAPAGLGGGSGTGITLQSMAKRDDDGGMRSGKKRMGIQEAKKIARGSREGQKDGERERRPRRVGAKKGPGLLPGGKRRIDPLKSFTARPSK
ncbi:MAG: ATP-dependent DNA/RNA helicase [Watsoniomyces obsoletus]|nr:MAG: ATP-dependent DNA/RNA helicase [Watsoniomyces obsoletus]